MKCLDCRTGFLLTLCVAAGLILGGGKSGVVHDVEELNQVKEAHAANLATLPIKKATELNNGGREWCQTEIAWRKKAPFQGHGRACATEGACDVPATRDAWIPDGSTPIRTLRIKFNVFCNNDGTSCAATQAGVDAQMVQLNSDFGPSKVQYVASTEFINNTTYRQFADSEEAAMKSAWADAPATQLNVYVVNIQAGYLGVGTFPWDPDTTSTQGGLIIDDNWFGSGQKTLTHEVGHCVGLWHTHHGVSEVVACSGCYERADGFEGDTTGDFASDTDPTPTNYNCTGPGGTDSCSSTAWGPTDPQNYMGYAADSCYTEFSPQQWGREHCWSDDQLTGWLVDTGCTTNGDCDDGMFCNGAETCVASTCQGGSDPCPGQSCDEGTDTCAPAPTLQYEWDMNTNPGWTTQGLWAWGQPTGGGGQHGGPDPTSGATGNNVYGYNLNGDYENNLAEQHLTTGAIDCSGLSDVSVEFQRWLGVEVDTYDHAYMRVSTNGSTWTTVLQNGAEVADTSWFLQTADISAIADGQPTVYLRWTMGTTDSSWQYCGWNIDDVQIWGSGSGGGCTTHGECDDGLFCNGAEVCNTGTCEAGTAPNCNDGVGCTDDSCNEGTDSCDNIANDANCDNGLWCDGAETCSAAFDCQSGSAPNCNDGVGCTDDSCNEGTDSCDNIANDANCDNGAFCDGDETCSATLDCQAGSDPCPGQNCDEGTDTCFDCFTNGDCDDGLFCNGAEVCNAGSCQAGTPPTCNDGVGCTDDSCNVGTDSCDNIANDANCDNGLWCDGAETCSATFDCQSGTAPNCNDGVGCTDDSCNEGTDSCDNIANNANCDNGVFCDGAETCHATLDCQAGGDPCPGQFCDEAGDVCVDCFTNGDCDDGLFCNGAETCVGGACQGGSDPCPGQGCDEGTDTCGGCSVNADCDDGSACTTDTCNAGVCTNTCGNDVSSYPYAEDFEAGLGAWTNAGGDVFDWTRDSGGTPSSGTGPSGDHTTGSGWYMYIETSSPRVAGDTAILESPCFDLGGVSGADLSFWYHMNGSAIGTLNVDVSTDCSLWTNVWTLSGTQGDVWTQATVDLTAYAGTTIKVRFVGVRGSSWAGDIAIDDVSVDVAADPCTTDPECDDADACTTDACVVGICQNTPISCDDGNACTTDSCSGGVCTNDCPAFVDVFPDTEDYEAGLGDWANVTGDDIDWTRNSGGTPSSGTGPSGDHTTGSGWYMYIEASSPNYPSITAILEGPCVDLGGTTAASMSFWYHMLGSAVGTLDVEVSTDCSTWASVWSLSGDQGSAWQQANIDLSAYTGSTISIRFHGVTGSSWAGDMCVDDVVIDASSAGCTVPADCDDGQFCNGAEDCVAGSCVAGAAVDCDDGVACTADSCNEATDSCDNTPNDGACDDGLFCNGSETCSATLDCQAGGDPCPGQLCDEGGDACVDCLVDGDCDDGLFCNGPEVCNAGTCEGAPSGGVANGAFDGSGSWTDNIPSDGSITYGGNLNVVGPDGGSQAFTWSSQSGVVVSGANLEFDLLSYSSSDTGDWDYPVFYLNGTFYGLNSNGTLGAATTGGTGGAGSISNGGQTSSTVHFVVDIDALAGGSGPHTIGFGVNSADGAFGAGTAVYDNVTPAGGAGDPCPGQTCDEVNDVCIP